jgi:hypothetical protein
MGLVEREAAYLLAQIEQRADHADRQSSGKFASTALKVYGVRVSCVRWKASYAPG